jgi:hypothetical protein
MNFLTLIGLITTTFCGLFLFVKFLETDFGFYFFVALGCAYVGWVVYEGFIKDTKKK